jgi:hypothetical protein
MPEYPVRLLVGEQFEGRIDGEFLGIGKVDREGFADEFQAGGPDRLRVNYCSAHTKKLSANGQIRNYALVYDHDP